MMNVFVVLGLHYRYNDKKAISSDNDNGPVPVPTGPGPPGSENDATKEVVIHLDPGIERLCPKCMSRKTTVLPVNGILPQPYDPEHHRIHRCYKDAGNWEELDPQNHLYKGRPYCRGLDDMLCWSTGLGQPNRYYDRQPRRVRDIQDLAILETFVSYIAKLACRILREQDKHCPVRHMRPYARKHLYENGLPEIKDQYWDYTLASLIVDLWRTASCSPSSQVA